MTEKTIQVLGTEFTVVRKVFLGSHSRWQVASIEVEGLKINSRIYAGRVQITAPRDNWEDGPGYWVRDLVNDMGNPITEKAIEKLQTALKDALGGDPVVADPTNDEKRAYLEREVTGEARYLASRLLYDARRVAWRNGALNGLMTDAEIDKAAIEALKAYMDEEGVSL